MYTNEMYRYNVIWLENFYSGLSGNLKFSDFSKSKNYWNKLNRFSSLENCQNIVSKYFKLSNIYFKAFTILSNNYIQYIDKKQR